MSFGDICFIIRRETGEEQNRIKMSKASQALKLFEQGNTSVHVAIKLNIETDEVDRLYREYWKLKSLHKLNEIYVESKEKILSFVKLYQLTKREGMTPQRVIPMRYELPNTVIIDDSNEFVQYLYNNCENLRTRHEQQDQTRDRGFFAGEI